MSMITTREAARRLGISPQRLRVRIARGELIAVRMTPKSFRIDEAEIDRFVAARLTSTPSASAR